MPWRPAATAVVLLFAFANMPTVMLLLLGEPVSDDNRAWLFGLLGIAAIASAAIVAVRATVRRLRHRRPVITRRVLASSIMIGFLSTALLQLASLKTGEPEIAAGWQNILVGSAAGTWWIMTRVRERGTVATASDGLNEADGV